MLVRRHGSRWVLGVMTCLGCGVGGDAAPPPISPSERSWSTPEVLEASRLGLFIDIAHAANGSAIVVWDDLEGDVNVKHYDATRAVWSAKADLDAANPEDSAVPAVAIDANGNAIAVWQRQSQVTDDRSVWTNRYDGATQTWAAATGIENSELVLVPRLAMDSAGNAVVAFTRSELGASVHAARFDAKARTWTAAGPLAPVQGLSAAAPLVDLAPGGEGVAIWMDGDLSTTSVWAARYGAEAGGWNGATVIGPTANMALPTSVVINDRGTAVAAWVQLEGEKFAAWTSRSEAIGQAWSAAVRLDVGSTADALLPQVAIDGAGNVMAVWVSIGDDGETIWSNRFDAAAGVWQGPRVVDAGGESLSDPTLEVDGAGNTLVVWTRAEADHRSPWARWYIAAEQRWTEPRALEDRMAGRSEFASIDVMEDGRALVLWSRDGQSLVASHFR